MHYTAFPRLLPLLFDDAAQRAYGGRRRHYLSGGSMCCAHSRLRLRLLPILHAVCVPVYLAGLLRFCAHGTVFGVRTRRVTHFTAAYVATRFTYLFATLPVALHRTRPRWHYPTHAFWLRAPSRFACAHALRALVYTLPLLRDSVPRGLLRDALRRTHVFSTLLRAVATRSGSLPGLRTLPLQHTPVHAFARHLPPPDASRAVRFAFLPVSGCRLTRPPRLVYAAFAVPVCTAWFDTPRFAARAFAGYTFCLPADVPDVQFG